MPQDTSLVDPDSFAHLDVAMRTCQNLATVVLCGEGDCSTLSALEVALERVEMDAVTCVHLDLAELGFADTATLRQLVGFVRQARVRGKDVRTLGASPTLRRASAVLGIEAELGLA